MRSRMLAVLVAVTVWCGGVHTLSAQVCTGEGDKADVVVKVGGVDETFTILRDFQNKQQFYYIPNKPRLAMKGPAGKQFPAFQLLKYQTKNPKTNKLVDGGILQFSVRLAPPAEVIPQMRQQIASIFSVPEKELKLAPLPFTKAEVVMYDLQGNLMAFDGQQTGVAPAFANNEIPFQLQLTSLSSDQYDALCQKGGGVPVYIIYTFTEVTPPTGLKVTVNWDQTFTHFSSDEKTKTAYGSWRWWRGWRGGTSETRHTSLAETLINNKSIKVESIAGKNFTQAEIDRYLDPILARIDKEMVENFKPPEKVEPAAAADVGNPSWGHTNRNFAVKNVTKVKKGSEVFEMTRREMFESKSMYGSLLGIGEFSDEVKKNAITIMPPGNWSYSYFYLPAVGDEAGRAIKTITLNVTPQMIDPKNRSEKIQIPRTETEMAIWKPDTGWMDGNSGKEIDKILFAMQGITNELEKKKIPLEDCSYAVEMVANMGNERLVFKSESKFLNGGIPVSTPLTQLEPVMVDCDYLTFGRDKGQLAKVTVSIDSTFPKKIYNATVSGATDSDKRMLVFLVEKQDEDRKNPVKAKITFTLVGGKTVAWKNNGKNLQDLDEGLNITLWDEDCQGQ